MILIQTLSEYINKIEGILFNWGHDITPTHPWFRGQSCESWELLPSLYRKNIDYKVEREMTRDFKLRSSAYLDHLPNNDIEFYFIMQHYGMPTRLLDWSESHLVALFFAVNSVDENDAAVWVLGPSTLNDTSRTELGDRVPMSSNPMFYKYTLEVDARNLNREVAGDLPVAVRPMRNTQRIIAQRGMFTIHGHERRDIATYKSENPKLKLEKLFISGADKRLLLKELYLAGISHSSLFPDMDGLCREISYRYSKNYFSTRLSEDKSINSES